MHSIKREARRNKNGNGNMLLEHKMPIEKAKMRDGRRNFKHLCTRWYRMYLKSCV